LQLLWLEPERPRLSPKQYSSIPRDQIEPVWPTGVSFFRAIVETIDHRGEPYPQRADASIGYRNAFRFITWAAKEHPVADITRHLPDIRGMGLEDVDSIEIDFAPVLLR
jgi:hypothetical protein